MRSVGATFALPRALDGILVVDLTRYLPGPYCTRLLADLGASIIKVEPPHGDPLRGIAWYDLLNRGKEIVLLDLHDPGARTELHALLARAHVCVEGFKPATARAMGVDGVTLSERYPALVHCSITGYGQTGRDADRAGHDVNYQVDAGLLGSPPRVPHLLIADITGAMHAVIAILAALVSRGLRATSGATLDISLFEAAQAWAPFLAPPVLRGEFACYNVYETADGRYVALGALEPKFWERFCRHVGHDAWISLQFCEDPGRTEILNATRTLFRSRSLADWSSELTPLDCCFSAIRITHP